MHIKCVLLLVLVHDAIASQELWRQLKSDLTRVFTASRNSLCQSTYASGNYPDANTRVFCTGSVEVIGFPCLNCEHKIDWGDYDSVKRCSQDATCMSSGLNSQLTGFNGEVNYVGQEPQMYAGTVYYNHGSSEDYQEFTYEKEEDETFSVTVQAGTSLSYSTEVSINVMKIASVKESFGFKLDLSTTISHQTVTKRSWSSKEHITLSPHTETKVNCYLMSDRYSGNFKASVIASGPVLIVVWNPEGTKSHPFYSYYTDNNQLATVQYWFPRGYSYDLAVTGLEGIQVVCDKHTYPLQASMDFETIGWNTSSALF